MADRTEELGLGPLAPLHEAIPELAEMGGVGVGIVLGIAPSGLDMPSRSATNRHSSRVLQVQHLGRRCRPRAAGSSRETVGSQYAVRKSAVVSI